MRLACAVMFAIGVASCARAPAPSTRAFNSGEPPAQATRLEALSSEGMPSGFELAMQPRPFEFPRDHGPHPAFRHEWWYVTGHLDAASGEQFGFELTFFRFALAPPTSEEALNRRAAKRAERTSRDAPAEVAMESDSAAPEKSAWRSRQIYMAHFAVTDINRGRFHVSQKYARDALGLAGAQAEPFRVWLEDWSLGTPASDSGPAGSSEWQLIAADKGYALDLQLRSVTPPVLNGEAGLSRKSGVPGAASYYYSMPRLAATGHLTRDGKPLDVEGLAWLDREWGSGSLGSDQKGWDWFALQLDDGSTLMFYALRTLNGARDPHSAGTWFAPDGTTHPLANEDVQIDVKDFWTSPRGARYPARWQLRVPSLKLDVDIRPRLADQELDTRPRYWEGAATIEGRRASSKVGGRAYVELVGYPSGTTN